MTEAAQRRLWKTGAQLRELVAGLHAEGVRAFNLPNKRGDDAADGVVESVRAAAPGAAVCPRGLPPVGVAFDPYAEGGRERERLRAKLATDLVSSVWLQFGSDPRRLDAALGWLAARPPPAPRVVGSVFLPTPQLLAQQRFRPWAGVDLTRNGYLDSPAAAEAVTLDLLRVYARHGVEVLAEAPGVRPGPTLAHLRRLLARAADGGPAAPMAGACARRPAADALPHQDADADVDAAARGGPTPPAAPQDEAEAAEAPPPGTAPPASAPELPPASGAVAVVVFQDTDLRTYDHPALAAARGAAAV
eukprot:gene3426-8239_t